MVRHLCRSFLPARHRGERVNLTPRFARPETIKDVGYLPVIVPGLAVASHLSGSIVAYDVASLKPVWKYSLAEPYEPLMPYPGAIVCSQSSIWINDDGVIAIVDVQTGREVSRAPGPHGADLLNGVVISDRLITAIDSADTSYIACFRGSDWLDPVWQFETASPTLPVAASEKLCCYHKSNHELAGIDLESGAERWSFSVAELGRYVDPVGRPGAGETTGAVTVFGDRVITGVRGYRVVAIDSTSGKLAWSHEVGAITPASLAVDAAGVLHILDFTGYWRIRVSDGKLLSQLEVETSLRANRVTMVNQIDVSDTHVFAAGSYGTLFALRQETGEIDWTHRFSGEGRFGNYPIATEGGLWHLDPNGNLFRFKVASRRS